MKYWRKYHPEINVDDPRYHQVSLIYSILLIMLAYFSVIGLLNVTLFDATHIAVYDFSGFVLISGIYFYVSRGSNFTVAGWLVTGTLIFVLLAFIHLAEGRNYSLIWSQYSLLLLFSSWSSSRSLGNRGCFCLLWLVSLRAAKARNSGRPKPWCMA